MLYEHSARYAAAHDGNISIYTLAGIPPLFGALRCLLIELNGGMYGELPRQTVLDELARAPNDVGVIVANYSLTVDLKDRLSLLHQIRHEVIHPAHLPSGDESGTPGHLGSLRVAGLLQSTGAAADYTWISQMQSHRLFRWAFETVQQTVEAMLVRHSLGELTANGLAHSYAAYQRIDAA